MQEFCQQHPAVLSVAIGAAFVAWFAFVSWITALVAGWRLLAQRYRTDRGFPEHKRWMQSARMRSAVRINHALTVGSDAEGLYMGMTLPIMFGYPRLFIPWSEVTIEEPQRWLFLMMRRLRLGPDEVPFRVREPLAQFLLELRDGMNATVSGTVSSTF